MNLIKICKIMDIFTSILNFKRNFLFKFIHSAHFLGQDVYVSCYILKMCTHGPCSGVDLVRRMSSSDLQSS